MGVKWIDKSTQKDIIARCNNAKNKFYHKNKKKQA